MCRRKCARPYQRKIRKFCRAMGNWKWVNRAAPRPGGGIRALRVAIDSHRRTFTRVSRKGSFVGRRAHASKFSYLRVPNSCFKLVV